MLSFARRLVPARAFSSSPRVAALLRARTEAAEEQFKHCPRCTTALEFNGMRKVCPSCQWRRYNNPTPVVAGIVELVEPRRVAEGKEANFVLVRDQQWPSDWFGLVTGFLEAYEDPAEGIIREVKEELGLDATLERLVGAYAWSPMNEIILCYHVRAQATPEDIVLDHNELAGFKIVPESALRPWGFGTGDGLRDFLRDRGHDVSGYSSGVPSGLPSKL